MRTMIGLLDDGLRWGQLHANESRPVQSRVREQVAELEAVDGIGYQQFVAGGDFRMSFSGIGEIACLRCWLWAGPEIDRF